MRVLDDLDTILRLIHRIEQTIARETPETFRASSDALDAVTYRLGMIGEHCKRLPDDLKQRNPDVPWPAMVGMRNVVVHGYDNVGPSIVWKTATENLSTIRSMAIAERLRLEQ